MYHITQYFLLFFLFFAVVSTIETPVFAQSHPCEITDRICILDITLAETKTIDNVAWRDQTYRELAKTYAFDGHFDKAASIIPLIETPDTAAMTIRGIGMTIAAMNYDKESLDIKFNTLRNLAEKITHPPSYAIALTYIAMAQAFAGDNEGAWKTAEDMDNNALRHKAYGETAEIQAERGDYKAAKISIGYIESLSYRNKAYSIVSGILANNALYEESYAAALSITNSYKQAQAIQYMLDAQKPRDVKH